jgi:hypothetical protein
MTLKNFFSQTQHSLKRHLFKMEGVHLLLPPLPVAEWNGVKRAKPTDDVKSRENTDILRC